MFVTLRLSVLARPKDLLLVLFPDFRPVENDPNRKVVRKALETVLYPCGGEEEVARYELLAAAVAEKCSCPAYDNVSLVSRVRFLRVIASRRINLHQQGSVLKDGGEALAIGRRHTLD